MQYITSAKLGPKSTWVGTTSASINNWLNQVSNYDEMGDPYDTISDNIKLVMIQNAVHEVPALKAVVYQAAQLKADDPNKKIIHHLDLA